MKIRKPNWNILTAQRLAKYKIMPKESGSYLDDPYKWDNAIRFEVENWATNHTKRMYIMRRWQKKIMNLPASMDWNRCNLLQILSDALCDKLKKHFKNPQLNYLRQHHPYSLAGYMARKPTRALLRYFSF